MARRAGFDTLARLAAAEGQLAAGARLRQVQFRFKLPASLLHQAASQRPGAKAPPWTRAEDDYLRRNLGWLSEAEIAWSLGRTPTAVHLRWKRDLKLPAPTKMPGSLTARKVAEALGVDPKAAARWVDTGLLRGRRLPLKRVTRSVQYVDLVAWALRPANWIYFRPERVNDPHLRRLLALKARRWDDCWLTAGEAARMRGVSVGAINKAIHAGKLAAVKHGNWRVRRSEVMRPELHFFAGKGDPDASAVHRSEPADAFIVLATAVGFGPTDIAQLMGGKRSRLAWTPNRVACRRVTLKKSGSIQALIRKYRLKVEIQRGRLFADWKRHRPRFPKLARAMLRLRSHQPLSARDMRLARRVLHTWAAWHGQADIARSLAAPTFTRVGEAWKTLRSVGVDPFGKPREWRTVRV